MPRELIMTKEEDSILVLFQRMTDKLGPLSEDKLDDYISKNPKDPKGYAAKALILQQNPTECFYTLKVAEEAIGPSDLFHHIKGIVYEKQGVRDKAIEEFQIASQLNPTNVEAIMSLATIYNRDGQHEDALKYWKQIIEISPGICHGWFGLSRSEYRLGQLESALKHMNAALFTVGKNEKAKGAYHINRAELHLELNNLEESLADYDEAQKADKEETVRRLKKSIHNATELKNEKQMLSLSEKLLKIAPDGGNDLTWYLGLATLYGIQGSIDKIDQLFERGFNAGLDRAHLLDFKGKALAETNHFPEAIKVYEELIELTGDVSYHFNIVQMAKEIGDHKKSEKSRTKILEKQSVVMELIKRYGPIAILALGLDQKKPKKIGRNEPCHCGSTKKFKHCHGKN